MPTMEYKPDAIRIDADFFEKLLDPENQMNSGRMKDWQAESMAVDAAQIVADAFWAATNSGSAVYLDAFVREMASRIRESDGWWNFVNVSDEVVRGETWSGEAGKERCPACGKQKAEMHDEWCCMQKRLPCDMDDVGYRPTPDQSQSPSYAGREGGCDE